MALPPASWAACFAAVRPFSVVFGNLPCRCSAMRRALPMASDHLGFVVQDLDQLLHRAHLAPTGPLGRRLELYDLRLRRGVHAEVRERKLLQLLLARLRDA